jgi:outer membrane protein
MKRISVCAVVLGALGAASLLAPPAEAQAAGANGRIGVIEVQRIVQESAIGKESLARVQKLQTAKQDELTRRQKELRDLEQKIQDQGKSLSEDAMEKMQKDYQAKALELKRAQDDAQRELEEIQRKELAELERRVMPVIDSVAKEQGFQLVFNKFQSGILFADGGVDITDAVIGKFNTQIAVAPKADAKPAAGAPPAKKPAPPATPAPKK